MEADYYGTNYNYLVTKDGIIPAELFSSDVIIERKKMK